MVPLSTSGSAAPANVVRKWNLVMSYLDSFHIHEIPFLFRNSEHKKDSIESYETQRNVIKKNMDVLSIHGHSLYKLGPLEFLEACDHMTHQLELIL